MCQYKGIIEHVKRKLEAFHMLKMCEESEVPRKAEYSTKPPSHINTCLFHKLSLIK